MTLAGSIPVHGSVLHGASGGGVAMKSSSLVHSVPVASLTQARSSGSQENARVEPVAVREAPSRASAEYTWPQRPWPCHASSQKRPPEGSSPSAQPR